ncbi:MAG: hypothetical protein JXR07_18135 [Reichenbachiella sp.]
MNLVTMIGDGNSGGGDNTPLPLAVVVTGDDGLVPSKNDPDKIEAAKTDYLMIGLAVGITVLGIWLLALLKRKVYSKR